MPRRLALLTLSRLLALGVAGCGMPHHPVSADGPAVYPGVPHQLAPSRRLTARDLEAYSDLPLDQALMRLRPEIFRIRLVAAGAAARPSVYVDDAYLGGTDILSLVPLAAVREVAYLTPSLAHDRYGSSCPCDAGAIVIATHDPR